MLNLLARHRRREEWGYSLIDLMVTTAIVATVGGMAVAQVSKTVDSQRLGTDVRSVERELQTARLDAVKANQPVRVRFNCPSAGMYRRVELIGTVTNPANGNDASANATARCLYPYPAQDQDPLTRPNNDGPIQRLNDKVSFLSVQTLEFWPNGTVHVDSGSTNAWPVIGATPVTLKLNKGSNVKMIQVNGLGKIQIQ
jgi:Tfp pilus assembly protein FimT